MKIIEKWFDSVVIFLGPSTPCWLKIFWMVVVCLLVMSFLFAIMIPLVFGKSPPVQPTTPKPKTVSEMDNEDTNCRTRQTLVESSTTYTIRSTMTIEEKDIRSRKIESE